MDDLLLPRATALVQDGYKLKSDKGATVILTKPKPINHILHLIGTICTFWIFFIWIAVWRHMVLHRKELSVQLTLQNRRVQEFPFPDKPLR